MCRFQRGPFVWAHGLQDFRFANDCSVKTKGAELEADFRATRELRLIGAIACRCAHRHAPKWKLNAGWHNSHALGSLPFEGQLSGTDVWQSEQSFTVTVFVSNVFDKGYALNAGKPFGNFGSSLASDYQPARDFERQAGVRVTFEF